jgi:hypothetical protein
LLTGSLTETTAVANPVAENVSSIEISSPTTVGEHLHTAVIQAYKDRLERYGSMPTLGYDISPIVEHYVHSGISFAEAEEILEQAGFRVPAHPSLDRPCPLRYDIDAALLVSSRLFQTTYCYVFLLPPKPCEYNTVSSISAVFLVNSL